VFVVTQIVKKAIRGEYNDFLGNVLHDTIYMYSKMQIIYNKCWRKISPTIYLFSNSVSKVLQRYGFLTKNEFTSPIEFYNKGTLINKTTFNYNDLLEKPSVIIQEINKSIDPPYNFIVYSDCIELGETKKINKICYTNLPNNFIYYISNIKFVGLMISYGNKQDELIELSTNDYNYYIVNNRIDKDFLFYYIKNIMKDDTIKDININDFDYKLTLYDNNAIIKELNKNDVIIIGKDSYEIFSYEKKENYNLSENDDFVIT
jgi:hypothetical protein